VFVKNAAIKKDKAKAAAPAGTVTVEPMHHLDRYWQDAGSPLMWDCLFMLPQWLGVWWSFFGKDSETHLRVVRQNEVTLGVAPLKIRGDTALLICDNDLIDYSDFIVAPSREKEFFSALFDHLRHEGISRFDTGSVRADSTVVSCLREYSTPLGCDVSLVSTDMLYEMDLQDTWEGYLDLLTGKERHEARRKLRRLERAGHVVMRVIDDKKDVSSAMDTFITLFRSNRIEKAQFMSGDVESFFRALAVRMAEAGLLRLFFLDLNDIPVASTMCFDYNSTVYLYNNGYDRRFNDLSAGLMSYFFSIGESISLGRKKFNFLRGGERYKGRLGGHPVSLFHCEVILK
jgi:CelD/BcsL family acetyltransferase involved in cellulose biosynthesis